MKSISRRKIVALSLLNFIQTQIHLTLRGWRVNLMPLLCSGLMLCNTSLGQTFDQKCGSTLCHSYEMGWPYVGLTLCWVDLMSGWPYVRLTLCRVDFMSGWPYVGLTLCRVDLMSGWPYVGLTLCRVDVLSDWCFVSQPF